MSTTSPGQGIPDQEFDLVKTWLSDAKRKDCAAQAIRQAIDWVIDGARTRRFSIDQLQTSEKTYIGNRIEHELLHQWGLAKEGTLDCIIEGIAVDIKFSLKTSWMIPPEAINQLCVIVSADDKTSLYKYGLLRARPEFLGQGEGNRDSKLGITALGRNQIHWIANNEKFPKNFLLHLSPEKRDKILSHLNAQDRVTELFRVVLGEPISPTVIDTLAVQRDSSKRVRRNGGARDPLVKEGIVIYGKYDAKKLKELGVPPLPMGHWISLKLGENEDDIRRLGAEPKELNA